MGRHHHIRPSIVIGICRDRAFPRAKKNRKIETAANIFAQCSFGTGVPEPSRSALRKPKKKPPRRVWPPTCTALAVRSSLQLAAILAACLFASACAAHRPALETWRLESPNASHPILIPPGLAAQPKPQLTVISSTAPANGDCPQSPGIIEVKRRKHHLAFTVFPDALAQQQPGWLAQWSSSLETSRCIPAGSAPRIAAQIAESVPLPPNSAVHLLHPNGAQSGQVDVGGQMRLQVVSPILNPTLPPETPLFTSASTSASGNGLTVDLKALNLIGYETAWYAVRPRPPAGGYLISPESAERHIDGQTEKRNQPATNYLRFPPDAAFYRLFYKSGNTDYTAIVLAARTWPELQQNSAAAAGGSCANITPGFCLLIPKRVAINPFIGVTVNGSPVSLAWGSTVADAIRHAGERRPAALLDHLCVERLYKGRPVRVEFNSRDQAVLSLLLTGGEAISWKIAAHDSSPRQ